MVMGETPGTPRERTRETLARVPACDSCRERKTKCNRGTPCSSCVTADLPCRVTRTRPEKRQRILISARYDETLESVDSRLQQLQETINSLQKDVRNSSGSPQVGRGLTFESSSAPLNGWTPRLSAANEGYKGNSSFDAQVGRIAGTLGALTAHSSLGDAVHGVSSSHITGHLVGSSAKSETSHLQTSTASLLDQSPELPRHSLPPSEPVLGLLRLAQIERQRFFVDVFVLDEPEFADLCREVFFAINPYTLYTWAVVNVVLFYLFLDLNPDRYADIGVGSNDIDTITELLAANAQRAVDSFRVCSEPSIEACQALALLGTFCMKSGQINRAWTLVSTAARMSLDLGLHTLPSSPNPDRDSSRKRKLFWHLYTMDTGLALTLGRLQSIHLYDVSTDRASRGVDVPGIPGKIYSAFFDMAILEGEMQPQLFSAAAQILPRHVRAQRVGEFRSGLARIQTEFNRVREDPTSNSPFGEAAVLLKLLLHSLETVVCSALGPDTQDPNSPAQSHSCADCVEAARECLPLLVKVGTAAKNDGNSKGWARFLNMFLSLAPFTPYIVLVTHAVTSYTATDIDLLASVNSVLEPVAPSSPMVESLYNICTKLYQLAESGGRQYMGNGPTSMLLPTMGGFTSGFESGHLGVQESLSRSDGSTPGMSLGDYQMVLAGLDVDASWGHM